MEAGELNHQLKNFYGTEVWYRHWFVRKFTYTEGVRFFLEAADAYWLLDLIATEIYPLSIKEEFLSIFANSDGTVRVTDGNKNEVYCKKLDFTTLPDGEWNFYMTNDVLSLPSEY